MFHLIKDYFEEQEYSQDLEDRLRNMLKEFYNKVQFQSLSLQSKPFIFAQSALITDEIEAKAKKQGFVECLGVSLTIEDFKNTCISCLTKFSQEVIKNNMEFETYQQLQSFIQG